jgi:hypothetical protein
MPHFDPIATLEPPCSAATLQPFIARHEPVLVRGGAAHLKCVTEWSEPLLRQKAGGVRVAVRRRAETPEAPGTGSHVTTLAGLLDLLAGPEGSRYTLSADAEGAILWSANGGGHAALQAALGAEVAWPELAERLSSIGLWVMAQGEPGPLHYDWGALHNVSAQVLGSRQVWLFPPAQGHRLYPQMATQLGTPNVSRVDLRQPDLDRFPLFRDAVGLTGEVHPGDALLVPSFWFKSYGGRARLNVHVNYWRPAESVALDVTTRHWAFVTHLVKVIGGGAAVDLGALHAQARQLGPEVIGFLARLEGSLLTSVEELSPPG